MDPERERLYRLNPELAIDDLNVLETLVKDFFTFLDYTEESDSGRIFHPITISCCRVMMTEPLSVCLNSMKKAIVKYKMPSIQAEDVVSSKKVINSLDKSMINKSTGMRLVRICNKCGTAHAATSRNEVNIFYEDFKSQFEAMDNVDKIKQFGSINIVDIPYLKMMESCHHCGNSHYDFHDKRDDEKLLDGITLQTIIKD